VSITGRDSRIAVGVRKPSGASILVSGKQPRVERLNRVDIGNVLFANSVARPLEGMGNDRDATMVGIQSTVSS